MVGGGGGRASEGEDASVRSIEEIHGEGVSAREILKEVHGEGESELQARARCCRPNPDNIT